MAISPAPGNDITFGSPGAKISASSSVFSVTAGDADSDSLVLNAGNSVDDGGLYCAGNGPFSMESGNGLFQFINGATLFETASLDAAGALQIDGDLTVLGNDINFGSGANIHTNATQLLVKAGDAVNDQLFLIGGNGGTHGQLAINGDGQMELRTGNGFFTFINGSGGGVVETVPSGQGRWLGKGYRVEKGASRGELTLLGTAGVQSGPIEPPDLPLRVAMAGLPKEVLRDGEKLAKALAHSETVARTNKAVPYIKILELRPWSDGDEHHRALGKTDRRRGHLPSPSRTRRCWS